MWAFLNPLFLWGAAAAIIPLILHLMQRRRTVRVRFSTLRFLKLAQKRSASRIRLENFLLWLLRTLLVLLIAAAFAGPVVRLEQFRNLTGTARRDVAIVWDASYSMSYESGSKRVWDESRDVVLSIIQGLSKGDRVCIFLADDAMTPLIQMPSEKLEFAATTVKAQEFRPTTSQLLPATVAACEALKESGHREREVYIVTDGQALPWKDFSVKRAGADGGASASGGVARAAAPVTAWDAKKIDPQIAFFVADVGVDSPENVAPLRVEIQPKVLMTGMPAKIATGIGFSGSPPSTCLSLFIDDHEIGRRMVALQGEPAGGEVVLNVPPLDAGVHVVKVETAADPVRLDDAFYCLLKVKDQLPILCIGSEADTFFVLHALNPTAGASAIRVKRVDPDAASDEDLSVYSAIVLCNAIPMPGQALLSIERYVRAGGFLVIFPGDRGSVADYDAWSCLPAKPRVLSDIEVEERLRTLRLLRAGQPIFADMKLPPGSVPVVTIHRQLLCGELAPDADAVIASGIADAFLTTRRFGKGHVLLFAVPADRTWSDLPLSPFFLPILHEVVQYSSGLSEEKSFDWTARTISLTEQLPDVADGAALLTPSQALLPIRRVRTTNETEVVVENAFEPGIYRLSAKDGAAATPLLALNVARVESDLTPVKTAEIPGILGVKKVSVARTRSDLERVVKDNRLGRPLAESFLWMALLVAGLEFILANAASRKTATLSERLTIEKSGRVKGKG